LLQLIPSNPRHRNASPLSLAAIAATIASAMIAAGASAESQILLPFPTDIGLVAATTFDPNGERLGKSALSVEERPDGSFFLEIDIRIDEGARNHVEAELEGIPSTDGGKPTLRVLRESSQSHLADGTSLALLQVDHVTGRASCTPPGKGPSEAVIVDIPEDDRVVNVPMNLLFLPLVLGEVDEVLFQVFICRGGPRLVKVRAIRAGEHLTPDGRRILEIRYGPDLGATISWLASRILPVFSFWFDVEAAQYVGHRMPLYSKGPDVVLVRDPLAPPDLGFVN